MYIHTTLHKRDKHLKTKYYEPGTHINLKRDEYRTLVTVSKWAYKLITPVLALTFIIEYALRVNGF